MILRLTGVVGLVVGCAVLVGSLRAPHAEAGNPATRPAAPSTRPMIEKLVLTDAQWRARLTPEQYRILRHGATEAPWCSPFNFDKKPGMYHCAGCDLPLFSSQHMFDSRSGWPSFYQSVRDGHVAYREDRSHGMVRTEILCARCDGHLGHVFDDGPEPTGKRYCLNGEAMKFVPADPAASAAK
jgi:methionine-R-sulfoxide reductase